MFTLKRTLVAWAATALVAATASAGDYWSEGAPPSRMSKARTVRYNADGRKITVWRDVTKATQYAAEPSNPFESPDIPEPPQDDASAAPGSEPSYQSHGESQWGSCGDDCGDCYSSGGCGGCGHCSACRAVPFWTYRNQIFGEFLYLQATGVDMAHAIQQNGVGGPGTTPDGRVGVVDGVWTPAYRAGFAVALSNCSSIGASYTNFQSHATDSLIAPDVVGGTVASLVMHPNSLNAGSTSSFVEAAYDIDFQTVDAEYRSLICGGFLGQASFSVGARYAKLDQRFSQIGQFAPPIGSILTATDIKFEGGGLRSGLDGQRSLGGSRLSIYGKSFINVLFGRFWSDYTQLDTTTTIVQAASNWTNDRVVPILECEAGVSFTSYNGRWRTSAGYYAAFWFNSVTTPQFVEAVQTANFINLGQTIAFEGLVSRLEYRF